MKIVVIAHEELKPVIYQWRQTLDGTREERRRKADALWLEFVRSIVDAGGLPEHYVEDETTVPPSYWVNFPGGLANIIIEPDRRQGLFSKVRRVVVTELNFSPGLRG